MKASDPAFSQVYQMPGEGLIAEYRRGEETRLFDIEGLQFLIVELRNSGQDTKEEERALALLSSRSGSES